LTDAAPRQVHTRAPSTDSDDDALITVTYTDGSACQLAYCTTGPGSYSKERVEVFAGGCAGVLEDFRHLSLHADGQRPKRRKLMQGDKGHAAELAAFTAAIRNGQPMPIAAESLVATTLATFATLESIQRGVAVSIDEMRQEMTSST
jgi:predicted dehydrogenase